MYSGCVSDSSITATICGNEEEALSLRQADQRESGDESESDQEGEVSRESCHEGEASCQDSVISNHTRRKAVSQFICESKF